MARPRIERSYCAGEGGWLLMYLGMWDVEADIVPLSPFCMQQWQNMMSHASFSKVQGRTKQTCCFPVFGEPKLFTAVQNLGVHVTVAI
jgi:hypothetical protein